MQEMFATGLYIQLPECAEDFCPLAHFWAYIYIRRRYRTLLVCCLGLW